MTSCTGIKRDYRYVSVRLRLESSTGTRVGFAGTSLFFTADRSRETKFTNGGLQRTLADSRGVGIRTKFFRGPEHGPYAPPAVRTESGERYFPGKKPSVKLSSEFFTRIIVTRARRTRA